MHLLKENRANDVFDDELPALMFAVALLAIELLVLIDKVPIA